MKRSFIREILEAIDEHTISFAGGLPSENLFPTQDLKIATLKAIENPKVYQYTISNGINELREQIALRYTNEGFATTKENILITTGSQQAMYILAKFFENKDITIEEPSYLGAMNIFRLNNLKMDGVKLEDDGVKDGRVSVQVGKFSQNSIYKDKLEKYLRDNNLSYEVKI